MTQAKDEGKTVPMRALFLAFFKLGTTSFGGGSLGWINREIVERRQWLSDDKFMEILTLALAMPGPNPVNMAVAVGQYLGGGRGALLAASAMVIPPFTIILIFASIYGVIESSPHAQAVLGGLAAIGLSAMVLTGYKSARKIRRQPLAIAIALAVFAAVGLLKLPMVEVVLTALPISLALSFWRDRRVVHGG